jgi:hypothetical protein
MFSQTKIHKSRQLPVRALFADISCRKEDVACRRRSRNRHPYGNAETDRQKAVCSTHRNGGTSLFLTWKSPARTSTAEPSLLSDCSSWSVASSHSPHCARPVDSSQGADLPQLRLTYDLFITVLQVKTASHGQSALWLREYG